MKIYTYTEIFKMSQDEKMRFEALLDKIAEKTNHTWTKYVTRKKDEHARANGALQTDENNEELQWVAKEAYSEYLHEAQLNLNNELSIADLAKLFD